MTKKFSICLSIILFISFGTYVEAAQHKQVIEKIIIIGNKRVETETVKSYLTFYQGDMVDKKNIDESLKKLFSTGLFANVQIEPQGSKITVKIIENPIINQIVFEGNKKLKRENLEAEIILKPRMVYSKTILQKDVNRLVEIYNKSGRFAVSVIPKIIQLEQNRINLIFEINEGNKTPISKIFFIGNKHFSDSKLSSIINTKEARWYRLLSSSDNYDPDRLEYDKELLRRFYNSTGYPDFKVISATAELSPNKNNFIITFSIEEGEKYSFGNIEIENKLPGANTELFKNEILTKKGELYNFDEIEDTIDAIAKKLNNSGFAFVNVEPILDENLKEHHINIKYVIEEGRKAYLNRININGNLRTIDKVIRREFRIAEGDPYNASLVNRSEQRIKNLDYFDKVEFAPTMADQPDKVDLNVNVEEKSTAKINFGAGYSTTEGVIGQISVTEDNFLGQGQRVGVSIMRAKKKSDLEFSFTEPYFLDREIETGFDVFRIGSNNKRLNPYKSLSTGVVPRVGYKITEYLNHSIRYTYKREKVSDLPADTKDEKISKYIRAQEGKYVVSAVGHNLAYDRTDSRINPTKGYLISLDQEFAGLGGDSRFIKNEVSGRYYIPILRKDNDLVLKFSGNFGHIKGIKKNVRITERFFVGDIGYYGLRGFAAAGIGPRIKDPNIIRAREEPLGGNVYYTGSAELTFPLGLPSDLDISGAVFTDVGNLFNLDKYETDKNGVKIPINKNEIYSKSSLRMSAGVGMVWVTRLGPIRLDFPYPLIRKKYDKRQYFHINFSTSF